MRIAFGVFGVVAAVAAGLFFVRTPPRAAAAADPPQAGAEASPTPDKAASPASAAKPHPGEVVRADLESLDAVIQKGLEDLASATAVFSAERAKWTNLDSSVAAARAVNQALLVRNRAVVGLYEGRLAAPLARFKARLREAPAVYRKMADERREFLAKSKLEVERRNYLAMVEMCEAAALLCERRHEELFGESSGEPAFGNRPRPNAVTLARTIENMKRLQVVHLKWEETFAAHPTALESPKLAEWFNALSVYGEDLDAFTRSVEGMKDAMKKKAAPQEPPAEPAKVATPPAEPVSAKAPAEPPAAPTPVPQPAPIVQPSPPPVATSRVVTVVAPYQPPPARVYYYGRR